MAHFLTEVVASQAAGRHAGIYSVCSAHRYAIEAAMQQALTDGIPVLIEATSNQVDQFGGYTGMTPVQFAAYVHGIAEAVHFPAAKILLGGDHLGPNRWRDQPAEEAMSEARDLVQAYVMAGFVKIHLDTSMRLGDDPGDGQIPPEPSLVAERAADLAAVAEETYAARSGKALPPLYIIGTDVPKPGGADEPAGRVHVTSPEEAQQTIEDHQAVFRGRGLDAAWGRVIGIVVQPGVEFGSEQVEEYQRPRAADLSRLIEGYDRLVYEAHSTDYQTGAALGQMVEDHFAILKVGPWLTFAFREGVFALAQMESEWLSVRKSVTPSRLREVLEEVMSAQPQYWQGYYKGTAQQQRYARVYSYSDRIRYYWPVKEVEEALNRLLQNITAHPFPMTLVSQYLPSQYRAIREGQIANTPTDILRDKIMEVTALYSLACGYSGHH
ncbi:MAG: D-tagatose-bisphosphate aldolase, class II, non-catalytic subunit [Fidelibacterota bacterium]|nr:MAG: D-tagatose-bisphosphate aldolase, class II, non-catalytic subunit [Candidatus Neomarinimicrobiota bacterium]